MWAGGDSIVVSIASVWLICRDRMNARTTLLNHFSQRYPKLPKSSNWAGNDDPIRNPVGPIVCLSFDFMSVRIGDMWRMSHYMDALGLLFPEEEEEDGDNVLQAVERDVNTTVDSKGSQQAYSNGSQQGHSKGSQQGRTQPNDGSRTEGDGRPPKDGRRRMRHAAGGSETSQQGQPPKEVFDEIPPMLDQASPIKRPCSPVNPPPDPKKAKALGEATASDTRVSPISSQHDNEV